MRGPAWLALLTGVMLTVIPQAQAQQSAFVVFFEEWSAAVDRPAQDVIGQAAAYAKAHPGAVARVTGFADPTGSRQANILLSELRAQVVADGLTAAGVSATRIRKMGRGSVHFAATPLEARRVEIRIGG